MNSQLDRNETKQNKLNNEKFQQINSKLKTIVDFLQDESTNLKENQHKIIELQNLISNLSDMQLKMTSEKMNSDLIDSIKRTISQYSKDHDEINRKYINFNEKTFLQRQTYENLQKLRKDKEKDVNLRLGVLKDEVKYGIKPRVKEMSRVIEEEKVVISALNEETVEVEQRTEVKSQLLEGILKENQIFNYFSNKCLWITALVELLFMFLVLAI